MAHGSHERRRMALFDSDDSSLSSCSQRSDQGVFAEESDADDDATAFTVSTVLETRGSRERKSKRKRRDTITRTMPTISINDKYAMPTTVERKAKETDRDHEEERTHLRVTASLMDESDSDAERDCGEAGQSKLNGRSPAREVIFRTPTRDERAEVSSTKSTALRRNTTWATYDSDPASHLEADTGSSGDSDGDTTRTSRVTLASSSDAFVSVYDDLAAQRRTAPAEEVRQDEARRLPPRRERADTDVDFTVKALVTTALRSVADGLAAPISCDGGSWDVDDLPEPAAGPGGGGEGDDGRRRWRLPRNAGAARRARAERTLLQEQARRGAQECADLKRKLEESQSQVKVLQREKAKDRAAADAAAARADALACQLRESRSEAEGLRRSLCQRGAEADAAKQQLARLEAAARRSEQEKKEEEGEREAARREMGRMREALRTIRRLEDGRAEKTRRTEAELREARAALGKAGAAAAAAEAVLVSLRGAQSGDAAALRARPLKQLQHGATPATPAIKWDVEWEEQEGGIEVAAVGGGPSRAADLARIDALVAEAAVASRLPSKAAPRRTPDAAARQLSFAACAFAGPRSTDKENHSTANARQATCALCCLPPRRGGSVASCQCGREECYRWAHASCLLHRRSVSSSVSHPGMPGPAVPTILCSEVGEHDEYDEHW